MDEEKKNTGRYDEAIAKMALEMTERQISAKKTQEERSSGKKKEVKDNGQTDQGKA